MAEERSNGYTPPAFSSTDEATPSTSRDNTQGASSTLGAYRTISDGPCPYQWNTQRGPIRDGTYSVDGASDNGRTGSLLQRSSTSIDNARPSTSRAGMAEAPALLEDGARFSEITEVGQLNTQYHPAEGTSTVYGHTDKTGNGSTGYPLPVYCSRVDYAVPSTSHMAMEEASGILGNDAW
ncbi:uncharacterized protein LOC125941299 [Dermacentor silvarum]|uniref:uncharacterized protein LOC125941299 n=1 Tax=Dermacentor silvarum TaxID=543639 RepID=UPI002100B373|nr:uncharacterized protein LOC125941299 [Dermacentor silvarum]